MNSTAFATTVRRRDGPAPTATTALVEPSRWLPWGPSVFGSNLWEVSAHFAVSNRACHSLASSVGSTWSIREPEPEVPVGKVGSHEETNSLTVM